MYCAGPEGLAMQNDPVLGETSGGRRLEEHRPTMFVHKHEKEQDVKLLNGSA